MPIFKTSWMAKKPCQVFLRLHIQVYLHCHETQMEEDRIGLQSLPLDSEVLHLGMMIPPPDPKSTMTDGQMKLDWKEEDNLQDRSEQAKESQG